MKNLRNNLLGYTLVLPAFLIYGLIVLLAVFQNFYYSFFKFTNITSYEFAGLDNYINMFKDKVFYTAIGHNLLWAFMIIILLFLFLTIAVFLSKIKSRTILGAIYFLPATIPFVVSAIMWGWIYNPNFGILQSIADLLKLNFLRQQWLGDPKLAFYSLFLIGVWTYFGFTVIIFLSALQNIDRSIYDAARIDGATETKIFFHITLPAIRNTLSFLIVFSIIMSMKVFDIIYVMTQGGPGYSTEVMSTYIFKLAFRGQNIGYSSAISIILIILVLSLAVTVLRRNQKE
ncbi:MAG: sugar ABC transporter permease [Actinomycetota bacterium]|nr:sugar ABC transporter permease [Actinomycetota bacterium]